MDQPEAFPSLGLPEQPPLPPPPVVTYQPTNAEVELYVAYRDYHVGIQNQYPIQITSEKVQAWDEYCNQHRFWAYHAIILNAAFYPFQEAVYKLEEAGKRTQYVADLAKKVVSIENEKRAANNLQNDISHPDRPLVMLTRLTFSNWAEEVPVDSDNNRHLVALPDHCTVPFYKIHLIELPAKISVTNYASLMEIGDEQAELILFFYGLYPSDRHLGLSEMKERIHHFLLHGYV